MAVTDVDYRLSVKDANTLATLNEVVKRVKEVNKEFKSLEKVNLNKTDSEVDDLTKSTKQLEKAAEKAGDAVDDIGGTVDIDVKGLDKLKNIGKGSEGGLKGLMGGFNDLIGKTKEIGGTDFGIGDLGGKLGMLANPAGAAAAAVAAVGVAIVATAMDAAAGAKEIAAFKKELSARAGLTGEDLSKAAINIKALTDTYGADEEQLIKTINAVSKNRKITFDEARGIVEDQLNRGMSSEALEWWSEYDVQLQKVGLTAKESGEYIKYSQQQGIYDDKAVDALKEAQLRLSEFNDDTRESLNVLGPQFVNTLQADLKAGKKTTFEVLNDIAVQSEKVGLNAQQQQTLVAGLASAAGEDSGRMLEVIRGFNTEMKKGIQPLTEQQKRTQELANANRELAGEYAQFGTELNKNGTSFEILWIKIKTGAVAALNFFMPAVNAIGDFFLDIVKYSDPVVKVLEDLWDVVADLGKELWSLVSDLLPSFSSGGNMVESAMNGLAIAMDYCQTAGRAFYQTLKLLIQLYHVYVNSAKELSNILLGTKFEINPEYSYKNLGKFFKEYGEQAKNGFKKAKTEAEKIAEMDTKSQTEKDAEEQKRIQAAEDKNRQKLTATQQKKDAGEPEKFEVKIVADLKPFQDSVKKAADEIRGLNEQAAIKTIQFQTTVDELTLQRSIETIERAKIESEQKVAIMQSDIAEEQTRREIIERKRIAIETLDTTKADQLKEINELKTASLKIAKKKELEKKYSDELKKINESSEQDSLAVDRLNLKKREQLGIEHNRALALLQIKTINDQRKRIDDSLKAQRERQKTVLLGILGESTLFKQRRDLELNITIANKNEIAKGLDTELSKIDASITEFEERAVAGKGYSGKDKEILDNLQKQRLNLIIETNNKIIDEENRFAQAQHKLTEQEIALQKDKFDKQVEQADKLIAAINKSFDKIDDLGGEFAARFNADSLKLNTDSFLTSINLFTKTLRGELGGMVAQLNSIKKFKFEFEGIDNSAKLLDNQIGTLDNRISQYRKSMYDLIQVGGDKSIIEGTRQQIALLDQQKDALVSQREALVGRAELLESQLKIVRENRKNAELAARKGVDKSSGEELDDEQKAKADEAAKALKAVEYDIEKELDNQSNKFRDIGKQKQKVVREFLISTAEIVGNAVFDALKAGTQATIDAIDVMLQKQQERIDQVAEALKEGGDAAKNYSVEQLEIEQNRAEEMEKQRAQEADSLQQYTIMQVALNGAIAVARTFAEYPFPISLGVAALQAAALFGSIAAMSAQSKSIRAEDGILDINDKRLVDNNGVMKGKRHSQGGVLIEAEGGETIVSRKNTQRYRNILEKIHHSSIDNEQLKKVNTIINNKTSRVEALSLPKMLGFGVDHVINTYNGKQTIVNNNEWNQKDVVFQLQSLRNDLKRYDQNNEARRPIINYPDDRMRNKTSHAKR